MKKTLGVIIGIAVALLLAEFAMNHVVENDPDLDRVHIFLRENSETHTRFGKISDITVTKLTSVRSTPNSSAYKLYALHVQGSQSVGSIEVVVPASENGTEPKHIRLK
ncbi:MAG: hypothetical protein V7742_11475 [Halioglobus sp.]